MRCAALAALLAADWAGAAEACSREGHRTPFDLLDRASLVAEVTVLSAPRRQGPVTLRVRDRIKGRLGAAVTSRENGTSCSVGYRTGKRALVFLDDRGDSVSYEEGYIELGEAPDIVAAVRAYAAAADPEAKLAVLIGAIENASTFTSGEAAYFLADRTDLLVLVQARDRDRLVAAMKRTDRGSPLPVVLARLRDRRVLPFLDGAMWRHADVARRFLDEDRFERVGDRERLAAAIANGKDESDPARAVALERCERVLGRSVAGFWSYAGERLPNWASERRWRELADRCRSGKGQPD